MCRFIPIMPDLENMEIEEVRDVLLQQAKWARKFATTPGKRQAAEVWMEVIKDLEISMGSEDPLPMAAPTKGCYEEG